MGILTHKKNEYKLLVVDPPPNPLANVAQTKIETLP